MIRDCIAALVVVVTLGACQEYGPVDASRVDFGSVVTIRIERVPEMEGPVAGAVFNFYSSRDRGATWTQVLSFRHDDPVPLEYAKVVRFNDTLVAIYMGWTYSLTRDGGKTWVQWDATKDLPGWVCCNYRLIRGLEFRPDGKGTLHMSVIDPSRHEYQEMVTEDFGGTWRVPVPAV